MQTLLLRFSVFGALFDFSITAHCLVHFSNYLLALLLQLLKTFAIVLARRFLFGEFRLEFLKRTVVKESDDVHAYMSFFAELLQALCIACTLGENLRTRQQVKPLPCAQKTP